MKQPEALRLADQLKERYGGTVPTSQAAAELRRLHEVNANLVVAVYTALPFVEDALLDDTYSSERVQAIINEIRTALAKA